MFLSIIIGASSSLVVAKAVTRNQNVRPPERREVVHQAAVHVERNTARATAVATREITATAAAAIDTIIEATNETQEEVDTRVATLETQNEAMQTEIDALHTEVTTLRETNQTAAATTEALTTELTALRGHSDTIHANLTSATEALQLSGETLDETTRQLDALRDTQEANALQHQREITHLNSELARIEQAPGLAEENQALQQELNIETARHQVSARQVITYAEELLGAEARHTETAHQLEALQAEGQAREVRYRAEIGALRATLDSRTTQHEAAVTTSERQLELLRDNEARLAEITRQFETLQSEADTNEQGYQSEIERLRVALESREEAPNQDEAIQALEQELNTVTAQYQAAASTARTYAEALRGARAERNTHNITGEILHDERRSSTSHTANRP
jgi:chromosome segregation ATPase